MQQNAESSALGMAVTGSNHIAKNKPEAPHATIRKVALASFVGTTVEWYDFFLTGLSAALVFDRLFFPNLSPLAGKLAAFGTYAVGFIARPIGGLVCGHYGDKIGRKAMLVLTLLLMGIATFLIGLLPTYASIGMWAPILLVLLRLVQGFGVGGEWGGAVLMAVEHAPEGKRGFYGSWPQIGVPAGLLLSSGVFTLASRLPEQQFLAWGWRIAFLLSVVMVGVGMWIRVAVTESPAFEKMKETKTEAKMPLMEVLRHYKKSVLLVIGARLAENCAFYMFSVFPQSYWTKQLGQPASVMLGAVFIAAAIEHFTIPLFGHLSDKYGRRPLYIFGAAMSGLVAFPAFWLMDTQHAGLATLAIVLGLPLAHAAMYAPQASFFSELFGTQVRYSGMSLGYQLSSIFAGGLPPLLAVAFLDKTGGKPWPVALMLVVMSVLTLISVYFATETAHKSSVAPGESGPVPTSR